MNSSTREVLTCKNEIADAVPQPGVPLPMTALLEANGKFRDEILAFKPQELLNECK